MENIQFVNQYEVTRALVHSWNGLSAIRDGKLGIWLRFALATGCGILAVVSWLSAFLVGGLEHLYIGATFSGLFFLLLMLPLIVFRKGRNLVMHMADDAEAKWVQTIVFGDKIEVRSGHVTSTYSYHKIRHIDETRECYYLWVGVHFILVVLKNAFTTGDAEAFSPFIREECSKKEPLWTRREMNKRLWKKHWPKGLVLVLNLVVIGGWAPPLLDALRGNTISQVANENWREEVQMVATVELPHAAVAFGSDGEDRVHAMLLQKKVNRFVFVDGHSYSIATIDHYNKATGKLFESKQADLSSADGQGTVVYGVANVRWVKDNVSEAEMEKYTVVPFQRTGVEYFLYYREVR